MHGSRDLSVVLLQIFAVAIPQGCYAELAEFFCLTVTSQCLPTLNPYFYHGIRVFNAMIVPRFGYSSSAG